MGGAGQLSAGRSCCTWAHLWLWSSSPVDQDRWLQNPGIAQLSDFELLWLVNVWVGRVMWLWRSGLLWALISFCIWQHSAGGRHVTAAAPSSSYTFPSVGRLLPPPALFGCMAFLCLVKQPHSMVRRGLFVFVLAEDVQNVLQSYRWTPVSLSRCMTSKQGEKLTLSSHLQVCGANFSVAPTAAERLSEVGSSRLQVVES